MRTICANTITETIKQLFLSAGHMPGSDALSAVRAAYNSETNLSAKEALRQLIENAKVSEETGMPYCQDTGMAVVFAEVGQDLHVDGDFKAAVNEGVKQAYDEGYLRKSVLDPLTRINTLDNTPAIIHFDIVPGDKIKLTAAPKGFGSENMSRIAMLKPSDGIGGIKSFVIESVKKAGGSPCPPVVLGIGIGGTFETCALLAKKQLTRDIGTKNDDEFLASLETELKESINDIGIGAMGFGGKNYCLAVHIAKYPTHIAGLPVAVNFQCHASRHASAVI